LRFITTRALFVEAAQRKKPEERTRLYCCKHYPAVARRRLFAGRYNVLSTVLSSLSHEKYGEAADKLEK
jgi:hypothetical protein